MHVSVPCIRFCLVDYPYVFFSLLVMWSFHFVYVHIPLLYTCTGIWFLDCLVGCWAVGLMFSLALLFGLFVSVLCCFDMSDLFDWIRIYKLFDVCVFVWIVCQFDIFVCMFVCLSVYLFVCFFVCLFVCLLVSFFLSLSVFLYVCYVVDSYWFCFVLFLFVYVVFLPGWGDNVVMGVLISLFDLFVCMS